MAPIQPEPSATSLMWKKCSPDFFPADRVHSMRTMWKHQDTLELEAK